MIRPRIAGFSPARSTKISMYKSLGIICMVCIPGGVGRVGEYTPFQPLCLYLATLTNVRKNGNTSSICSNTGLLTALQRTLYKI